MKKNYTNLLLTISIVLLIFVLIMLTMLFFRFYPYWFGLETERFQASVEVTSDRRGAFDLNDSALTFGVVSLGGAAERSVIFNNTYNIPVIAKIEAEGNISELMESEREVLLGVGESSEIFFRVEAKEETQPGFYEGEVTITLWPVG